MKYPILVPIFALSITAAWTQDAPEISAEFPFESNHVDVHGSKMHYIDVGEGDPMLFLHGNPTSSYLWRNIIPHVQDHARCIAPDLIGMGKSDKPDIDYTFFDHAKYVDAFIEALDLENITLVIHDWGSGLGFHYARRHPDNVAGIAFMEAIIAPMESYADMGPAAPMFQTMRNPDTGRDFVIKQNAFVEQLLPGGVVRGLTEAEMNYYREPFEDEAARKPVYVWPNQVPIAGEPADVVEAVTEYNEWLQETDIPKLLFHVTPGVLMPAPVVEWCREHLDNLTVVDLGPGIHYVQEDHPRKIGQKLAEWYQAEVQDG